MYRVKKVELSDTTFTLDLKLLGQHDGMEVSCGNINFFGKKRIRMKGTDGRMKVVEMKWEIQLET